jgi:hypothetical protein
MATVNYYKNASRDPAKQYGYSNPGTTSYGLGKGIATRTARFCPDIL